MRSLARSLPRYHLDTAEAQSCMCKMPYDSNSNNNSEQRDLKRGLKKNIKEKEK
jgi:hypothetical protein